MLSTFLGLAADGFSVSSQSESMSSTDGGPDDELAVAVDDDPDDFDVNRDENDAEDDDGIPTAEPTVSDDRERGRGVDGGIAAQAKGREEGVVWGELAC